MEDLLRQVEERIAFCRYWQEALPALEEFAEKLRRMIADQPLAPVTLASLPGGSGPANLPGPSRSVESPRAALGESTRKGGSRIALPAGPADLAGVSIKTAARHLLSTSGNAWTNYRDLAKRAFERGYRSGRLGDDLDKTAFSFLDTLRRADDVFERNGQLFRLRPGVGPAEIEKKTTGNTEGRTLADCAAEIVRRNNGAPMKTTDLMNQIVEAGLWTPVNLATFYSAVYSALDRSKQFKRGEKGLWIYLGDGAEPSNGVHRASHHH